jgi:hypothetical protein
MVNQGQDKFARISQMLLFKIFSPALADWQQYHPDRVQSAFGG